jgi:hypothetical protein
MWLEGSVACATPGAVHPTTTGPDAASVSREPYIMTFGAPTKLRNARQYIISRLPKGGVGAEIGVWNGEFSARLLRGAYQKHHISSIWKQLDC